MGGSFIRGKSRTEEEGGAVGEENAELKKRCCDLFSEVIEAKASNAQ